MIPNELILMRDVCQNLNKGDSDSFRKFVSELPISLQNMVKNKLYFYSSSNGLSLKTILKIKKINE